MGESRRWMIWAGAALLVAAVATWGLVALLRPRAAMAPPPPSSTPPAAVVTPQPTTPPPLPVLTPGEAAPLLVLMYHHVNVASAQRRGWVKGLTVSPQRFARDLQALRANRCTVMTMTQAVRLIAERRLPERAVVLTFDDGYDDNYSVAAPLLSKYGMVATFNVVVSKVGAADHMTAAQLVELQQAGHEIGCHSMTHADLRTISAKQLDVEVAGAKHKLEELLGQPVVTYCYPAGKYTAAILRAVEAAGFRIGLSTDATRARFETDHVLAVPRFRVMEKSVLPLKLLTDEMRREAHERERPVPLPQGHARPKAGGQAPVPGVGGVVGPDHQPVAGGGPAR